MGRWEDDVLRGNGYGYVGNYTEDEPDWGDDDFENDDYEAD